MIEILWQYDPGAPAREERPTTARAAQQALTDGNRAFAEILGYAEDRGPSVRKEVRLTAADLGLGAARNTAPEQLPFAAVLSCADARVPVEMVTWQEANDLFVVRVAGNAPGAQSLGSFDYAVNHLASVRLLAVLGHTGCGAVTAAVDAFLTPASYMSITADLPLRSIVDSIMTAVCGAAAALAQIYGDDVNRHRGYRTALIELAVIMNAALAAAAMRQTFRNRLGPHLGVVYGVFNLVTHEVGLPGSTTTNGAWKAGLHEAPEAAADFHALTLEMASSAYIAQFLS